MSSTQHEKKAVFHMGIATIFFFGMGLSVKLLQNIPISQIVFFRGFVALCLCMIQFQYLNISPWGVQKKLLIMRGIFGTTALILFFTTLHHLPMATAVTIQYVSPLLTTLFMAVLLKEKVHKRQYLFFLLALAGVFLVKGFDTHAENWPFVAGLFGALFSALAYTTIKKMGTKEHPMVVIFYFPLIVVPVTAPFAIKDWVWPNHQEWILLIMVGIFVQIAQFFMTMAYQRGKGSIVPIVNYLGVVWASVGGYLVAGEKITPVAVTGMILIFMAVYKNVTLNTKEHREELPRPSSLATFRNNVLNRFPFVRVIPYFRDRN